MLNQLTIRSKLFLGFGIVVLLVLANAAWVTVSSRQTKIAMESADRASATVVTLKDALLEVRQGRVMTWSYMATGEANYLTSRDTAFKKFEAIYQKALSQSPPAEAVRLMGDFNTAVIEFRDAAVRMNDLKTHGFAMTAPEVLAVMKDVDAGARRYSEANGKASAFLDKLNDEMTDDAYAQISASNTILLVVAGLIVVLSAGIALLLARAIATPARELSDVIGQLAKGVTQVDVPHQQRGDEIGQIAKSVTILRDELRQADLARADEVRREEAERKLLDRRQKLADGFVARMQSLASGFAGSSSEVADSARNLSSTAEECARQAQAVAVAAEQAATNVQTVAASSEELAASVREITKQVSHSADVADVAFREAEASNTRISALAVSATAIGDVINLIKGIADQTNLLALNATIEAARAGDNGKGFAVVASEVKQLAAQTAQATADIAAKVNEIQSATTGTVTSMTEIVRVISDIKEISSAIASAVEEQGAATGEIAENCQQAASGTQEVTDNISGVGRAAEMTGSASTQLLSLSEGLSSQATELSGVVQDFVRDLQAA